MDIERIKTITKLSELKELNECWHTYSQKDIDRLLKLNEAKKYNAVISNINNKIELVSHIRTVIFNKMEILNKQLISLENDLAIFSKDIELLETQKQYVETRNELEELKII